ncbi:MAG: hypothetical protein LBQ09_07715, partial [Acidobacteriaceae bacterium]|nr:hypothetical protein [Acidobacteriaceae bacterium]
IAGLSVEAGEQVALTGFDQPSAEVFISLVTGAALPDSGTIEVCGRRTADIVDSADWLSTLDRFGIVSERAALVDQFSVAQNLALPFSLEIDPPPPDIYEKARVLALESGLGEDVLDRQAGALTAAERMRMRFARALALGPSLLLVEHPSASVPAEEALAFARDMRRVLDARGVTSVTLTADRAYAEAAASRVLALDPATGALTKIHAGLLRFW